jgi:hypothetical protein
LATLLGGYKPKASWMTNHMTCKVAFEKQVFYRLIVSTKNTRLTPMPIPLNEVIFSKNNPLTKIPCKKLFLSGIFILHIFLLSKNGKSVKIKALYIEATENLPFQEDSNEIHLSLLLTGY